MTTSRYHRDSEAIDRDLCICLAHPVFRDLPPIHALRWLRYMRGEWV